MYRLETDLEVYYQLKEYLTKYNPEVNLVLDVCDYALAQLGFVKTPPCIVRIDINEEKMEELKDDLYYLETCAFNGQEEYFGRDDEEYILYLKYSWLAGILEDAELI